MTPIDNETIFCRECNNFFELTEVQFKCLKCGSKRFEDSEFPTPDGEMVLQCKKCKKMYSLTDFLKKNEKIKL